MRGIEWARGICAKLTTFIWRTGRRLPGQNVATIQNIRQFSPQTRHVPEALVLQQECRPRCRKAKSNKPHGDLIIDRPRTLGNGTHVAVIDGPAYLVSTHRTLTGSLQTRDTSIGTCLSLHTIEAIRNHRGPGNFIDGRVSVRLEGFTSRSWLIRGFQPCAAWSNHPPVTFENARTAWESRGSPARAKTSGIFL